MQYEWAREGPPEGFPALTPLAGGRYTNQDFFALERERVWRRSWLLAAREEDFPAAGSYRVFERAGPAILLVRGDDGVLRAFYNTCQHRGAPVVRDACGSAKRLRCQYHSWTYDLAGKLVSVPDRRDFTQLDESQRGLRGVRCEAYAGWVFVNEDAAAPSLLDWLGPLAHEWQALRGAELRAVARREKRVPCNWKVAADAFLETYHVNTIHPATVARLLDHRGAVMGLLPNGNTRMVTPKWPEAVRPTPPGMTDIPALDPLIRDANVAYGVFPNLITPLDTFGFPFITFWPVDVRTTDVEWVWYAPPFADGMLPPVWEALLAGFDAVMDEDFGNLAPMQRSLESPGLRSIPLSYQERRIYHLHEQVDRMIGEERIPPELRVVQCLAGFVE